MGVTWTDNDDGTATLAGSPYVPGTYVITLTAANSTGSVTQTFSLVVNAAPAPVAPAITSGDTTAFTVGQSSYFLVTTSGYPAAGISEAGTLPAGITLMDNGDGTAFLWGTPLVSGSVTVTLTASNGTSPNATQSFTLIVNAAATGIAPAFTSANTTAFTVGQASSFLVSTTGNPTPTLSAAGTLPAGVFLFDYGNGLAVLGGVPLASGTFTFTLTAANGISANATQSFTLVVNGASSPVAPAITSGDSTAFTAGQTSSFLVTTTGYPTATLSETGTLPVGVFLVDNGNGSAYLAGTPQASGTFTFTITAANGVSANATQSFTLNVNAGSSVVPAITSGDTTAFTVGQYNTFAIKTTGYPAPSLSEVGTLLAGIYFVDIGNGTAILGGTPLCSGTCTFTITAANGVSSNATQSFTLTVNDAPAPVAPSFTSGDTTAFTAGQSGLFTVITTGYPTASLSEAGTLPAGVWFVDNGDGTATLSGTPLASGTFALTLTATNGVSTNATQSFTLTVNTAPNPVAPTITSGSTTAFNMGQGGHFLVTTTGFPHPTLSEVGTLPAGVLFGDNGDGTARLSGTPLESGTFTFTLTAANGVGSDATQSFTLVVNAAPSAVDPTITSGDTTAFTVGQWGSFLVTTTGFPTASLSETGTLPAGITLVDNGNGTASLSGRAIVSGIFTLTIAAVNSASSATQDFTLTINAAPTAVAPAFTSVASATFTVGQTDSFLVLTTGFPTPTLSFTGTLPAGVTLEDNGDGTASLGGTPMTSGTYTLTLTAANSQTDTTQSFTLTVSAAASPTGPAITSGNTGTFTAGQAGTFTVTTTGSPTPSVSETGTLPGGITLVDNGDGTATLSGSALASGTFTLTLTATNGVSTNATQSFTLTVNAASSPTAPSITSGNSTTFTAGQAGTFTITTTGSSNVSLSETGALPAGVALVDNDDGTATLSEAALTSGTFTITITAANGVSPNATQTFTLTVNAAATPVAPAITSASSATFTAGQSNLFTVTSTGTPNATLSETGTLPAGVQFVDNGDGTGTLEGYPLVSGTYTITILASNNVSPDASQSFTLKEAAGRKSLDSGQPRPGIFPKDRDRR